MSSVVLKEFGCKNNLALNNLSIIMVICSQSLQNLRRLQRPESPNDQAFSSAQRTGTLHWHSCLRRHCSKTNNYYSRIFPSNLADSYLESLCLSGEEELFWDHHQEEKKNVYK